MSIFNGEEVGTITVYTRRPTRDACEITHADKLAVFSLEIVTQPSAGVIVVDDLIVLAAENGILCYRIESYDPVQRALVARLVSSSVEGITP